MAPLPHDQEITSWPQLLTAIEDAEAGRGTAHLTEICLSVYSALAAAQFQITQLKARVHVLATSKPCPHADPTTVAGSRLPPARTIRSQGEHSMGLAAGHAVAEPPARSMGRALRATSVAVACSKRRNVMRSAATMPPHTPCWPISQCRSDSVRHWARTGHVVQTAIAAAAS
jgi:hypothetical protein